MRIDVDRPLDLIVLGAAAVFERMLWLNPMDNQGARFNFAEVRAGRAWSE